VEVNFRNGKEKLEKASLFFLITIVGHLSLNGFPALPIMDVSIYGRDYEKELDFRYFEYYHAVLVEFLASIGE
jgi:hypothetical protein